MTNDELQTLTENISITFFQKPFKHKAIFNPRLRTTGGRYILSSHYIEINKKYLDEHGIAELEGIIKHELCHYHLHIEGRGYKHRDPDFRQLMKKVDAPRHCTPLATENRMKQSKVYHYRCSNCYQQYNRKRRVNTERYVCGICKGKLMII